MRLAVAAVLAAVLPAITAAQDRAAPRAAPSAAAPAAKPGAAPPAAARDLARALLSEERWNKLLDGYAASLSEQVARALQGKGEQVPDGLQPRIREELGERLQYQQTIESQAQALAAEFTADELKKTASFYATPAGRKVLERLPEAQATVSRELQARLSTAVPELLQEVAPKALAPSEEGQGSGAGSRDEPPAAQGRRPPETQQR
jgi:hypothetical protein